MIPDVPLGANGTTLAIVVSIERFLELQKRLLESFKIAYPNVRDWALLFDAPKSGQLSVDHENWSFKKHGAGLRFTSSHGVAVDVHRHPDEPDLFDAWRLLQYIESAAAEWQVTPSESELSAELEKLSIAGLLSRSRGQGFRLATKGNG